VTIDGVPPTIDTLIRRWSSTDQDAYVQHVSRDLAVDPDTLLDLPSQLPAIAASITSQENGVNPYSLETITAGLNLV
jgi:hypothetical protein